MKDVEPNELESNQAYADHEDCPICNPAPQEGLCQNCKEFVFPIDGFCPICGQDFVDIQDRDEDF